MTRKQLVEQIFYRRNYLLVGLDTDPALLPMHLRDHPDGVFEFNRRIIDATKDHCVGYKVNTAFYEALGMKGWETLCRTADYIPSTHYKIADAKRGDIGNTATQYARAFFEAMNFDALTVAPYMGEDSVRPFLEYENKWTILLGLTSNPGARDFELQKMLEESESLEEGVHIHKTETRYLYEKVLDAACQWGNEEQLMFVIGATRGDAFTGIRARTPGYFYLVPGVGAQGGSLKEISEKAMISDCGLLVNASRAIIYASGGEDFAEAAAGAARTYAAEMSGYLKEKETKY